MSDDIAMAAVGFCEVTLGTHALKALERSYTEVFAVHFALSTAPGQLDRLAARARAGNRSVRRPVEHDGADRSLYLEDPDANLVEV